MTYRGKTLAACLLIGTLGAGGCGPTTAGTPTGPDVGKVADLPVTHFESGLKPDAPEPDIPVENATNDQADKIAIATIADVSQFWAETMPKDFGMDFQQVKRLLSYDSNTDTIEMCGRSVQGEINAFFCPPEDAVAWDRGELLPRLMKLYGDVAPIAVLAHEYGHAVQHRLGDKAGIPSDGPEPKTIVLEAQADCFTGAYFRWIVEGKSKYFQVSTAEGLNAALSTMYLVRDAPGKLAGEVGAHGTAFDRTLAFREGFTDGPKKCASYDEQLIRERTTQFRFSQSDRDRGDMPVTEDSVRLVKESLDRVFGGQGAPELRTTGGTCPDGSGTPPASYCPDENVVTVDLAALAQIGTPIDRGREMAGEASAGKGDFAAYASLASRYTLAVQKAEGKPIDDMEAALRAACLTGAWAKGVQNPEQANGPVIRLSPGDVDEAILEMLQPESLIGSNVSGGQVPSGFLRVEAFGKGYLEGRDAC
jgi:predicted metalloprotease